MIREIWDHFAQAPTTIAGGANSVVQADTDLNTPYDQVDLWFSAPYQWQFEGVMIYAEYGNTTLETQKIIHDSDQNHGNRMRFSFPKPVQDIHVDGIFYNRNAANAIRVVLHLNTVRFVVV